MGATQQRIHQKWKNKKLLGILCVYTLIIVVALSFMVKVTEVKQDVVRNLNTINFTVIPSLRPHPAQGSVNESFIFTVNKTAPKEGAEAGLHNMIPKIDCSKADSLANFWNQSKTTLEALRNDRKFISLLVLSSASSNESIADHFINNLCKSGTRLQEGMNQTLSQLIVSSLQATASPTVMPRQGIMKYYRNLINNKVFSLHCPTCAMVSSSGRMLGSNSGKEIDSHSCVIRMNKAPSIGFEKDVGSRTTVRLASFVVVQGMEKDKYLYASGPERGKYSLFWGLDHKTNAKYLKRLKDHITKNSSHTEVYYQLLDGELLQNKHFLQMTGQDRQQSKSWLSTGWFTFELALDLCDKLNVYGMVPEDQCLKNSTERIKYHYYQTGDGPTECSVYNSLEKSKNYAHRFMTEKAVFAKWAALYNVSFFHPSWNISVEAAKNLNTPFIQNRMKMKQLANQKRPPVRKKARRR